MLRPEEIRLEQPYAFSLVDMRDEALCTDCGPESYPWSAAELMAIPHRDRKRPDGRWKIYCPDHFASRPEIDPDAPLPEEPARRAPRATAAGSAPARTAGAKAAKASKAAPKPRAVKPTIEDEVRPLCPNCCVAIPLSGVCGLCGERPE